MTDPQLASPLSRLTPRELECLRCAARPMQPKEIAAELRISPKTVEGYLDSARRKLDVPTRTAAIRILRDASSPPVKAPGGVDRVGDAPPSAPPPPSIGDETGRSKALLLGESQVRYRAGGAPADRFEWPVPTAGRPRNQLGIRQRLFWVAALTVGALLAVGSFLSGILALSGAIRGG